MIGSGLRTCQRRQSPTELPPNIDLGQLRTRHRFRHDVYPCEHDLLRATQSAVIRTAAWRCGESSSKFRSLRTSDKRVNVSSITTRCASNSGSIGISGCFCCSCFMGSANLSLTIFPAIGQKVSTHPGANCRWGHIRHQMQWLGLSIRNSPGHDLDRNF